MSESKYPLILEPAELEKQLSDENLLIIDLCKPKIYAEGHIPSAIHVDYDANHRYPETTDGSVAG